MNKYKICVYAICKNEAEFINLWLDSVGEADTIIVLDTGSSDNSVELLKASNARVYQKEIKPWRFDEARNMALSYVPDDVDICVSIDLDERFKAGWRNKLEEFWDEDTTRARYLYTSSFKADNTPERQFARDKIHIRNGYKWVNPVHEVLEYQGTKTEKVIWIPGLLLNHYMDRNKSRSQYLPLLELSVKENPNDDRSMFWLGREYMYYGKYEEAIQTLNQYLTMPTAIWEEERCAAMRFIAKCYEGKNDSSNARAWMFRAIAECSFVREPYFDMVCFGYKQKEWPLVMAMAKEALSIDNSTGSYLTESEAWGYELHDYAAISMYYLGMYEESFKEAIRALEMEPNNERLMNNLKFVRDKL